MIDPATDDTTQIFHPRVDTSTDHFLADESDEIIGLTPIGRGTVVSLVASSATSSSANIV